MSCQQKSGIFLNLNCSLPAEQHCESCKKKVCKSHTFQFDAKVLCENCHWETYLYATEQQGPDHTYYRDHAVIGGVHSYSTSNSSSNADTNTGFNDGFGEGGFGGGGASADWTEGDMQSFDDTTSGTQNSMGLGSDNDNTFFYS